MDTQKTHEEFTNLKDIIYDLQGELCELCDMKKIENGGKSIGGKIIEYEGVKSLWSGTLKLLNYENSIKFIAIITYIRFEKYCNEPDTVFVSLINNKFELLNQYNSTEGPNIDIDFNIGLNIGICDACIDVNKTNYYNNNNYKFGYLYGNKECINFMQNENNYVVYKKN